MQYGTFISVRLLSTPFIVTEKCAILLLENARLPQRRHRRISADREWFYGTFSMRVFLTKPAWKCKNWKRLRVGSVELRNILITGRMEGIVSNIFDDLAKEHENVQRPSNYDQNLISSLVIPARFKYDFLQEFFSIHFNSR